MPDKPVDDQSIAGGDTPRPPDEGTADSSVASQRQSADRKTEAPSCTQTLAGQQTNNSKKKKKAVKSKKPKKPKNSNQLLIRYTARPIYDYLQCLKALDIEYRSHAYRGAQVKVGLKSNWERLTDLTESTVYKIAEENCTLTWKNSKGENEFRQLYIAKSNRQDAINTLLHQHRHNPLKDWLLKEIKPIECVDRDALDLVGSVFQPDIKGLMDANGREFTDQEIKNYCIDVCLMIGKGVWHRTMTPDSHFSFLPTLIGEQGRGKSEWIKALLPKHLSQEVVKTGLNLNRSNADRLMICRKSAIMECGELAGYGKKEIEDLKAFISDTGTVDRTAYSRFPEDLERHFIIIATTNNYEFLVKDPSGNRRWIPIVIEFKDGWTPLNVMEKMRRILTDQRLGRFWSHISWLARQEGCSYSYWQESSRQIRDAICNRVERRAYNVEEALAFLLKDIPDAKDETDLVRYEPPLTAAQLKHGIFLDVPPDSKEPSIMKMLPPEIVQSKTASYIGKIATQQGWKTIKIVRIRGRKCSLKLPPQKADRIYTTQDFKLRDSNPVEPTAKPSPQTNQVSEFTAPLPDCLDDFQSLIDAEEDSEI